MVTAIILSGGRGKRVGSKVSKQYIKINNKPCLYYTLKRFLDCGMIDNIILVLPKDEIEFCKREVIDKYNLKVDKIVEGGKERYDSVFNALKEVDRKKDIVLIHDGARPFVSDRIIKDSIKYAKEYGAASPGVMPKDTIKIKDDNNFSEATLERDKLVCIQTPQSFKYDMILECHKKIRNEDIKITDDTMVVEYFNNKVYIFEGDYNNIKITTPEDLIIAEYLSKS